MEFKYIVVHIRFFEYIPSRKVVSRGNNEVLSVIPTAVEGSLHALRLVGMTGAKLFHLPGGRWVDGGGGV